MSTDSSDSAEKPTVLLVDDDPFMLRLMDLILRDEGYDIIQARSGEEALSAIRERPKVDLVISDVVMPGMNGELLRDTVRHHWPHSKFIVCSGYPDKCWDLANGEQPVATLPKPFTATVLKKRVRVIFPPELGQSRVEVRPRERHNRSTHEATTTHRRSDHPSP